MTRITKSRMRLAALIASTALLHGCERKPKSVDLSVSPDRVAGTLPPPTSAPADSEAWTRLTITLDETRAEIGRKNAELQSAENRRAAANLDTWKRFGKFSWAFIGAGTLLLILSLLPWTRAFFAGTSSLAFILIGAGTLFGIMPYMLENFGRVAFYPMAAAAGTYVFSLAAIDIFKRIRKARAEAEMTIKVLDPQQPEKLEDLVEVRKQNNPTFARALEKAAA